MSQLELDPVLVTPLRRPETRPRKRRRSKANQASPYIMKVAAGIVVGVAILAFAGRIAAFAVEPVLATVAAGKQIRSLNEQKRQEAQVNEQLRQDIIYLNTPAGIEQEARRRGWVKPGEVALSIVQPEAPAAAPKMDSRPVQTASARASSFSDRVQSVLDTCLAVFGGGTRTR